MGVIFQNELFLYFLIQSRSRLLRAIAADNRQVKDWHIEFHLCCLCISNPDLSPEACNKTGCEMDLRILESSNGITNYSMHSSVATGWCCHKKPLCHLLK